MDNLRQDLRYAVRRLVKSPGFSAVAILCIALGIGTNVTAFSVVSALLLRPFPYAEPERLVYIRSANLKKEVDFGGLSWLDATDFRSQTRSFSQMGIYSNRSLAVATGEGEPERISGCDITASLFPMLGEKPMLGRHFREDEDRPGAPPVEGPKVRRVEDVVRRLAALPGIETVAASNTVPLWGGGSGGSLILQSRPFPRGEEPSLTWTGATAGFFPAIGLSAVRGRPLTEREAMERSAVALVNESFVNRFFPEAEVLGQRFRVREEAQMGWITIVGVVPDIKLFGADSKRMPPVAFLPYPYLPSRNTGLTIRTRLDPAQVLPQVRREIHASDPGMPIYQVFTMEQIRLQNFWEYRFLGGMFLVFGASPSDPISFGLIALLLTLVASLASFLPANRAMDVDPLEALRNE